MYLDNYTDQIHKLCKQYKVKHLFAFGSVLTDQFKAESDIDMIVDINSNDPIIYAENYFNLKFKLEELLNRSIDLLEQKGLKNSFLKQQINNSKKAIYEA